MSVRHPERSEAKPSAVEASLSRSGGDVSTTGAVAPSAQHDVKPEIRFAGFADPWEQRKLGDVVDRYKEMVPTPQDGYIRLGVRSHAKGTFLAEVAAGEQIEEGELCRVAPNNLIVNIVFAWEHAVAITGERDAKALVSHRFPQFTFHDDMDPQFFKFIILDERFRHHLWLASPSGAGRNKTLNVGAMLEYGFVVPTLPEQRAIGQFFSQLDSLITLHQCEYDKLCVVKKSMLEKMFPRNGAAKPEIRFAGFADPWEQRKLGEVADRITAAACDGDLPRVEYEDINSGEGTLNKAIADLGRAKSGILFDSGDVLYGKLRPYLHNWLHPQFRGIAVGDFWVLRPKDIDGGYLYRLVQGEAFDALANVSSGSKMPRADWSLISSAGYRIPSSRDEQRKIAATFDSLDSLITLHQRKLDLLKNVKKSLLVKMFV